VENIILLKKETNKIGINNKKSKKSPEKADINGSRTGLGYTAELDTKQKRKHWEMAEEEEKRSRGKYNNNLAAVPSTAEAKMQYFADAMLHLLPDIFHGSNWDTKFDTWLDFCEFYISYFDPAYDDYLKANKKYEKH